ncbi:probable ribosomal protein S11, mitochondrial [Oryza brachyantha]|uniref:Ribosomal protein S11 n=1 Tax=Oryza brachyantha TaxID=4533 RepID=J3LPB4_ORYBR|nr:probable ribosomal protein S11, mitochondrial [Oryza brachyantha]
MASRRLIASFLRAAAPPRAPSAPGYLFSRATAYSSSAPYTGQGFPPPGSEPASRPGLFARAGDTRQPSYGERVMASQQLRQDYRARTQADVPSTNFGATMSRIAGGEKSSYFRTPSHIYDEYKQSLVNGKRDLVHISLKRNKTFVTVTDVRGNKKTGASAGCLEDRKGRARLSKYAAEATAEHVGRAARKMGLKSVIMKVKGAAFFTKKKKVILGFREGFRGERVREQSPVVFIHDVTQLPHNGCRLPKQRRI